MAVVETSCGKVRGLREGGLFKFRGVPYAAPPVGALRFRPPRPAQPWRGVLDATTFGPAPPQDSNDPLPLPNDITHCSEDCLRLNIVTPQLEGKRPVLLWLHGGAFVRGTASRPTYDRGVLPTRGDIVFVSVEYRLGVLGFLYMDGLCGNEGPVATNLGIRDQILALEWVQREIAAFGGDADNVTIAGHSAGSVCIGTLLAAPAARGKFRRAILQSGPPTAIDEAAASPVAATLLDELGLVPSEAERLREAPVDALLQAQLATWSSPGRRPLGVPFAPVIDGDLLDRHPMEAIADGVAAGVPILTGTTADEMTAYLVIEPELSALDEDGLRQRCEGILSATTRGAAGDLIATYKQARKSRGESVTCCDLWLSIKADRFVRYGTTKVADLQCAAGSDAYAYNFTWRSPFMGGMLGAFHELELPFLFGYFDEPFGRIITGEGPERNDIAAHLQNGWTNFSRRDDPSHPGLSWQPYGERRATMKLDVVCEPHDAPFEEERRVWEEILPLRCL